MEAEAISALTTVARTAKNYLKQCGNDVITPEDDNELAADVLYNLLNRKTSNRIPLSTRINEVIGQYITNGRADDIDHIPAMEYAPLHPLTLRTPDIFLWMAFTTLIS